MEKKSLLLEQKRETIVSGFSYEALTTKQSELFTQIEKLWQTLSFSERKHIMSMVFKNSVEDGLMLGEKLRMTEIEYRSAIVAPRFIYGHREVIRNMARLMTNELGIKNTDDVGFLYLIRAMEDSYVDQSSVGTNGGITYDRKFFERILEREFKDNSITVKQLVNDLEELYGDFLVVQTMSEPAKKDRTKKKIVVENHTTREQRRLTSLVVAENNLLRLGEAMLIKEKKDKTGEKLEEWERPLDIVYKTEKKLAEQKLIKEIENESGFEVVLDLKEGKYVTKKKEKIIDDVEKEEVLLKYSYQYEGRADFDRKPPVVIEVSLDDMIGKTNLNLSEDDRKECFFEFFKIGGTPAENSRIKKDIESFIPILKKFEFKMEGIFYDAEENPYFSCVQMTNPRPPVAQRFLYDRYGEKVHEGYDRLNNISISSKTETGQYLHIISNDTKETNYNEPKYHEYFYRRIENKQKEGEVSEKDIEEMKDVIDTFILYLQRFYSKEDENHYKIGNILETAEESSPSIKEKIEEFEERAKILSRIPTDIVMKYFIESVASSPWIMEIVFSDLIVNMDNDEINKISDHKKFAQFLTQTFNEFHLFMESASRAKCLNDNLDHNRKKVLKTIERIRTYKENNSEKQGKSEISEKEMQDLEKYTAQLARYLNLFYREDIDFYDITEVLDIAKNRQDTEKDYKEMKEFVDSWERNKPIDLLYENIFKNISNKYLLELAVYEFWKHHIRYEIYHQQKFGIFLKDIMQDNELFNLDDSRPVQGLYSKSRDRLIEIREKIWSMIEHMIVYGEKNDPEEKEGKKKSKQYTTEFDLDTGLTDEEVKSQLHIIRIYTLPSDELKVFKKYANFWNEFNFIVSKDGSVSYKTDVNQAIDDFLARCPDVVKSGLIMRALIVDNIGIPYFIAGNSLLDKEGTQIHQFEDWRQIRGIENSFDALKIDYEKNGSIWEKKLTLSTEQKEKKELKQYELIQQHERKYVSDEYEVLFKKETYYRQGMLADIFEEYRDNFTSDIQLLVSKDRIDADPIIPSADKILQILRTFFTNCPDIVKNRLVITTLIIDNVGDCYFVIGNSLLDLRGTLVSQYRGRGGSLICMLHNTPSQNELLIVHRKYHNDARQHVVVEERFKVSEQAGIKETKKPTYIQTDAYELVGDKKRKAPFCRKTTFLSGHFEIAKKYPQNFGFDVDVRSEGNPATLERGFIEQAISEFLSTCPQFVNTVSIDVVLIDSFNQPYFLLRKAKTIMFVDRFGTEIKSSNTFMYINEIYNGQGGGPDANYLTIEFMREDLDGNETEYLNTYEIKNGLDNKKEKQQSLSPEQKKIEPKLKLLNMVHNPELADIKSYFKEKWQNDDFEKDREELVDQNWKKNLKQYITMDTFKGMVKSAAKSVMDLHPKDLLGFISAKKDTSARLLAERLIEKTLPEPWREYQRKISKPFSFRGKPSRESYLSGYNATEMEGGDPLEEENKELFKLRKPISEMLVSDIYTSYNEVSKKWGKLEIPLYPDLGIEAEEMTIEIPDISGISTIRLPRTLDSEILKERIKGIDINGKEIPLTASANSLGEIDIAIPKGITSVLYSIEKNTLPSIPRDISMDEYVRFAEKAVLQYGGKINESVAQLPVELEAFLLSIDSLSPKNQVMAIESFVRDISYYDFNNKETQDRKQDTSIEELMMVMGMRMNELRIKDEKLAEQTVDKKYAGVCADFAKLTAALLRRKGFISGVLSGFRTGNQESIGTKQAHGTAFVVFPDEKEQMVPYGVDGTPGGITTEEKKKLEEFGLSKPSMKEKEAMIEEKKEEMKQEGEKQIKELEELIKNGDEKAIAELANGKLEKVLNTVLRYEVNKSHANTLTRVLNAYWYTPFSKEAETLDTKLERKRFFMGEIKNIPVAVDGNPAGTELFNTVRSFAKKIEKESKLDKHSVFEKLETVFADAMENLSEIEKRAITVIIAYLKADSMKGKRN